MKSVVDVDTHQYIIFISKLYSGIFILPTVLTPFMFAYIIWENKDGKEMKAMFQIDKAIKMADMMREVGVDPKFVIELHPAN